MKTMTRIIQLSVLLVAACSMSAAVACTTGAWSGGVTGDPAPLGDTPETALPRVSGVCAMTLTDTGSVKDESPVGEDEVYIRFYVLGDLSEETVIFEAFSNDSAADGTELISITFDGANFVFDAGAGASPDVPGKPLVAGKPGWNMIQLSWLKNDTMAYAVNADTSEIQTGSVAATDDFMESVILGTEADLNALGDKLIFDDYESHRETPVAGLLMGDVNGSGALSIADVIGLFNELNGTLATGQPDCNSSGSISIADVICLFNNL